MKSLKIIKVSRGTKKLLYRFKLLRLKALFKFKQYYNKLKTQLLVTIQLKRFYKNNVNKVQLLKLLRFIEKQLKNKLMIIILALLLLFPNVAYADGIDNLLKEHALAGALIISASIMVCGIRYLIMGDSAVGLIDKTKNAGNDVISNAKNAGNDVITNAEGVGTRLIDHAGNTLEQKANGIMSGVDARVTSVSDAINPVSHAQAMGENAVQFVKKVLNKANDALNSNSGFANVEEEVKIRLQTGLQRTLADLDKTGNVNAALQNMTQEDMAMLAEYTVISREPSTAGSIEMVSVLEPLSCMSYCIFPALVFALLMSPFILYFWIKIKKVFFFIIN